MSIFKADNPTDYFNEASALRRSGEFNESAVVLRAGLNQFPDDPSLLNAMAKRLRSKWRDDEALEHFKRAHELAPGNPFFAGDYADFIFKQGDKNAAELLYLQYLDPDAENDIGNNYILTGLGSLYQKIGDQQLVATCFGRVLSLNRFDEFAAKRFYEVKNRYGMQYSPEKWQRFVNYAREVLADAGAQLKSDHPAPPPA